MSFLETYQAAMITLAEQKLGRGLTEKETFGIRNIHSPMFLEAVETSWTLDPNYTNEQIEKDLDHFSNLEKPFKI